MSELMRLRKEVHYYLDSIWLLSSDKRNARSAMYEWLSSQMNLPLEDTHVRYFTEEQCKQALRILKTRYKQLYGKNNISLTEKRNLYIKKEKKR